MSKQKGPQAHSTWEGEVYSHRQLWRGARAMRARAEADASGRLYFDMAAMLFARLTLEAYCNFVLDVLDPELFANEREHFGSSIDAKLAWVAERAAIALDRGKRPYQTVGVLNRLRDKIVHAKPEVYAGEELHPAEVERPFMAPGELESSVAPEACARALADVEALCEELHAALYAAANVEQKRRLEPRALAGSLQRQVTSTTLAQ
jgi:hypothetical protein